METPPQFDLNKAILAWRGEVANSPAISPADVDELETHLRDSVSALEGKGLAAHEAFWVATNRLGSHGSLQAEFAKINVNQVWIERLLWMLTGSMGVGLVCSLGNGLSALAAAGVYTVIKQPVVLGPLSLLLRLAIPALLILVLWRYGRHHDGVLWRLGRRLKSAPGTTAIIAFLVTFFSFALSSGAQALLVALMPMRTYASFVQWTWSSGVILALLVPAILWWLLAQTKRTRCC